MMRTVSLLPTTSGRLLVLLASLTLLGASCSVGFQPVRPDGGIFKSTNLGVTWQQAVFVAQAKDRAVTIGALAIDRLLFSPLDPSGLYAVAREGALYETRNGGEQWQKIFSGPVAAVALHPKLRDSIYLASSNQVLRTTDGGKTWSTAYLEGTPKVTVTDVALDSQNPRLLYLGTSAGVLLRSSDGGQAWQQLHVFDKHGVRRLILNQHDGKIVYVVTSSGALWRSGDGGVTWEELMQHLQEQLKLDPGPVGELIPLGSRSDGLLVSTSYGLFRTINGGTTWESIHLVTPPNRVTISGLGVNPVNELVMFYSTGSAFYRTTDGGKAWQTLALPAPHPVTALGVQPPTAAVLYLGFGH